MDENNLNKAQKKGNFSTSKKRVWCLENQRQVNNNISNQNEIKNKLVINESKNNIEKAKPKPRETDLENKPQIDAVETLHSKNNSKKVENLKNVKMKKLNQKKKLKKKSCSKTEEQQNSLQTENRQLFKQFSETAFEFEDIINNPKVLDLIEDLVSCFTNNSTLPENELQTLKVSLCEKTCSVFLNILNSCVTNTAIKVLNSDFIKDLKKEKTVLKADACCQTSFSDTLQEKKEKKEV